MKKLWLGLFVILFLFVGCPPQHKNAAKIYINQSEFQKAKEQILAGIEETPGDFEYYCLLGKVEISLGNWREGSEAFQKSFKMDTALTMNWLTNTEKGNLSAYWQNFYNAALNLSVSKNFSEALLNLRLAEKLDPTNVQQEILKGNILAEMGDKAGAIKAYNKVLSIDPENAEAHYFIAMSMFEKKAYDSCTVELTSAIKYFTKQYDMIKNVLFQNAGYDKAVAYELVKLWSDKKMDELARILKTKLGIEQLEAQKRNVEKLAKVTEGLGRSYYLRGMTYYNNGKDSLALKDWNSTLDLSPDDLNAIFFTAELLISKFKKYDEARSYLEHYTVIKKDDYAGWFYIGVCYSMVKNYKKAIEIYEDKALKYSPDNIDVLTNLAFAYREDGNNKKSYEILMKIDKLQKEKK